MAHSLSLPPSLHSSIHPSLERKRYEYEVQKALEQQEADTAGAAVPAAESAPFPPSLAPSSNESGDGVLFIAAREGGGGEGERESEGGRSEGGEGNLRSSRPTREATKEEEAQPSDTTLPPILPPSLPPLLADGLPIPDPPPAPVLAYLEATAAKQQRIASHCLIPPPPPPSLPPSLPPLPLVRPLTSLRAFASPEERRLRAVYRDLWERGLTIGSGSAYGADFTAYEGRFYLPPSLPP